MLKYIVVFLSGHASRANRRAGTNRVPSEAMGLNSNDREANRFTLTVAVLKETASPLLSHFVLPCEPLRNGFIGNPEGLFKRPRLNREATDGYGQPRNRGQGRPLSCRS
jgi:hypothetical protein